MEAIRGVQLRKFKLRKIILGVRMHFRHNKSNMWYMIYSQIMPPRPPLPRKVGGSWPPSSYGSAAPGSETSEEVDVRQGQNALGSLSLSTGLTPSHNCAACIDKSSTVFWSSSGNSSITFSDKEFHGFISVTNGQFHGLRPLISAGDVMELV